MRMSFAVLVMVSPWGRGLRSGLCTVPSSSVALQEASHQRLTAPLAAAALGGSGAGVDDLLAVGHHRLDQALLSELVEGAAGQGAVELRINIATGWGGGGGGGKQKGPLERAK